MVKNQPANAGDPGKPQLWQYTSNLPDSWASQVPMQYCSSQHRTLPSPPDTTTTGIVSIWLILFTLSLAISLLFPSSILDTYQSGGSSFRVIPVLPFHTYCSWGSQGKDTEVVCHSFLQWRASLVAQLVKNLPAMQETPVRFLGGEDMLEKGIATHSSVLGLPWWLSW